MRLGIVLASLLAVAACSGGTPEPPGGIDGGTPPPASAHYTGTTASVSNYFIVYFPSPMPDTNYEVTVTPVSSTGPTPPATAYEPLGTGIDKTTDHVWITFRSGPGEGSTITWDVAVWRP